MIKRSSVVFDTYWESDDTRVPKNEQQDFYGKCSLLYPAFVAFLKKKRARGDSSHDSVRRSLYDVVLFRDEDSESFKKRVFAAVTKRAHHEKVVPGMTSVSQYRIILDNAYAEAARAKKS